MIVMQRIATLGRIKPPTPNFIMIDYDWLVAKNRGLAGNQMCFFCKNLLKAH